MLNDSKNVLMFDGDISKECIRSIVDKNSFVTIDTETTGLNPIKNELCLIQIYDGENVYLCKYNKDKKYENLKLLLEDKNIKKVFHHANFDLRFLSENIDNVDISNVACTKISAKLLNGLNEKNSLKYLVSKYLGKNINKEMQKSDWSKMELSDLQLEYACNDVIYLYDLWVEVKSLLEEKGIYKTAEKCFDYLPTNALLHNRGIENIFIY